MSHQKTTETQQKRTQILHFSCFTFNQRYNLQRKNWNHKSLEGPL